MKVEFENQLFSITSMNGKFSVTSMNRKFSVTPMHFTDAPHSNKTSLHIVPSSLLSMLSDTSSDNHTPWWQCRCKQTLCFGYQITERRGDHMVIPLGSSPYFAVIPSINELQRLPNKVLTTFGSAKLNTGNTGRYTVFNLALLSKQSRIDLVRFSFGGLENANKIIHKITPTHLTKFEHMHANSR